MRLLDEFFAGRRENTRRAYQGDLEAFKVYAGQHSAGEAIESLMQGGYSHCQEHFARYLEHLLRAGKSRATTARQLAAVRSVLVLAHRRKLISWEPPVRPPFPPAYQDTARGDLAQTDKIIAALETKSSPIAVRDLAMVLLISKMAIRRAEMAALTLEDVSLERMELTVRRSDGRAPDVLPIPPEAIEPLRRWVAMRGDWPGSLFIRTRNGTMKREALTDRAIGRAMARYRLESPRTLRHAAITSYLEQSGGDLSGAREFGRVRRSSTVRTYELNRQKARDSSG
jgi:integrase